jgi:hypothetical protein
VAAPKKEGSKYLIGADGVVVKPSTYFFSGSFIHHPVCGNKVAVFLFMPQPPLLWPGGAIAYRHIPRILSAQFLHS